MKVKKESERKETKKTKTEKREKREKRKRERKREIDQMDLDLKRSYKTSTGVRFMIVAQIAGPRPPSLKVW